MISEIGYGKSLQRTAPAQAFTVLWPTKHLPGILIAPVGLRVLYPVNQSPMKTVELPEVISPTPFGAVTTVSSRRAAPNPGPFNWMIDPLMST